MLDHCAPALTAADLDAVEDSLGLTLPRDVREHYLRWNGGTPRATCWVVDDEVVVDVAAVRYGDGTRYGVNGFGNFVAGLVPADD